MSAMDCAREHDIVAVVLSGRWPDGCEATLRLHAESCPVCRDVVAIAPALRRDQQHLAAVRIPAAGQVWWKAAIRARADAARAAARPMVWLQAITGAGAVGAVIAGMSMIWPRVEGTARLVMPSHVISQEALPVLLVVGIGLVAAPIAFYLAVPRD